MEYIVTCSQMKNYDRNTSKLYGISGAVLMERAAVSVCDEITADFQPKTNVLIVCGPGNNGGDGLATGRILSLKGYHVDMVFIGDKERISEETQSQWTILKKYGFSVLTEIPEKKYEVIVDALFGIGLTRELTGRFYDAVSRLNEMEGYKVAVDVPSGINADNGSIMGIAFRAELTVTFAFQKIGLFLGDGKRCAGKVVCRDIGITSKSFAGETPYMFSYGAFDLSKLPKRSVTGNKGTFGKVLVVAGNEKICGACVLCARSAYRCGAGYVRVFTHENNRDIVGGSLPEAVIHTYGKAVMVNKGGCISCSEEHNGFEETLEELCRQSDVIAIGPGIGTEEQARIKMEIVLRQFDKPVVVDADGINVLAGSEKLRLLLEERKNRNCRTVMTPHMLEFSRLLGKDIEEVQENRIALAQQFAQKYAVVLVCKDYTTIIAEPTGQVYVNQSGNNAMATAGTGDVLTGMIAGLIGQKMNIFRASCLGAYAHGLAGNLAKDRTNSYYVIASDLIENLQYIMSGRYGNEEL